MKEHYRALYFPHIRVPDSSWFTRVLLYWDEVGAIVPYDYVRDSDKLGPYMLQLMKESLVRQVIPGEYLPQVPDFKQRFLGYIDAIDRHPIEGLEVWPRVHMEKLQRIGQELVDRKLAVRDIDPWFKLEPATANDFMAYLAGVLGQVTEFDPVTDKQQGLLPFLGQADLRNAPIRRCFLEGILPAPAAGVSPGQLATFKSKYIKDLRRFRTHIEDQVSRLSVIQDERELDYTIKAVISEMSSEIDELVARMSESKWRQINIGRLIVIASTAIQAFDALRGEGNPLLAGLTIAYTINDITISYRNSTKKRPLAYAALASRKLYAR